LVLFGFRIYKILILCRSVFILRACGCGLPFTQVANTNFAQKKESDMKLNSLTMAVAVGMLSVVSASAFGSWNNATYASRYRVDAQSSASLAKPEVQVAVLATVTSQQADASKQSGKGEVVWCRRNWCATHSH
jgi:hypothetical protein